ncbi:MAG: hypothetical protein WCD63_01185, partial [Terrimicrobiaceae bacterium]
EMETLSPATPPLAADEKIRVFRSLFRGREDICAVRWEGKNGKAGYSPAHIRNGWFASKAEARANREFLPLTDAVIRDHLSGKLTAGVYPLLKDETCWFLAADFDKTTWQDDTTAFLQTCSQSGVPAYLERSRSGGGAHVWIFLSLAKRLSIEKIHEVVREAERTGNLVGVRFSACDEEESDPWLMPPSQKKKPEVIAGPLPDRVAVTLGNLVYVPKDGLPSAMLNQLLRLAAFQNPEFYRAQAMRLSTFGKPRVIHCAEEFSRHLGLPRGCQSEVMDLLDSHGIQVELADGRFPGTPLDIRFYGELRPDQERAATELLRHDTGVLSAGTAFGKTVVVAWMIAARKTNTLVLVHRRRIPQCPHCPGRIERCPSRPIPTDPDGTDRPSRFVRRAVGRLGQKSDRFSWWHGGETTPGRHESPGADPGGGRLRASRDGTLHR